MNIANDLFFFTDIIRYKSHKLPVLFFLILTQLVSLPLLGRDIPDHLIAGAAGFAVFLVLAVATRGGIGGGDIKLIAALGLWLGTDQLLTVACTGMILGGVAALLLLATKRRKRGEMFAYGPYFTVAALVLTLI